MSDTVALTGIIVLGLVVGVVAIVGIVFGVPVRSRASRDGFELHVDSPPQPARKKKSQLPPADERGAQGVPP